MSFDFLKHASNWEDEELFAKICEGLEEVIREAQAEVGERKIHDLELMQALDFVGFNLFRDNWDEFKKMDLHRDLSYLSDPNRDKNFIH
ncbi:MULTISPECIES: hypothetical protein [unclassified Nitrospina]|uniref:hypothetical protein n=1 Tax=unclassified Nitrospina TaxID=2638683 RepID=UPI003F96C330